VDIEERIKQAIIAGLDEIPEVGGFFALLIEELWPEKDQPDPWEQIKEKVEQLINQKISDQVYAQVQDSLRGLSTVSNDYTRVAKLPDSPKELISTNFIAAKDAFDLEAAHFKEKGYELLLLPLFAQMANLYLILLRDGCMHAADWGWKPDNVTELQDEMRTTLAEYVKYVNDVYQPALLERSDGVPGDGIASFNRKYGFIRGMTVSVLDYQTIWPYMDAVKFPKPVKVRLNGEVYSDAYGDLRNRPPIAATPLSWRPMTRIQVWAGSKIDAVKVWYGGIEGPKMGGDGGEIWMGGDFDLSQTGPVEQFWVFPFDALWGLGFGFEKGAKKMGFYNHPDYKGQWPNPFFPPDGYCISGITATGPDLVRAIYFHYRYDNGRNDDSIVIKPGTEFQQDLPYSSGTGAANLIFQSDGNLVDYDENKVPRWASQTGPGKNADRCIFRDDGNLVVYPNNSGQPLWESGTQGHSGASMIVQGDGNIVIYDNTNEVIWSTHTDH
jgi:hypothetical protein